MIVSLENCLTYDILSNFELYQFLHKDVTSAIDVYLFSNSICIYNELEKFILKVMNRKNKNKKFLTFAEIGLGMLHKHMRVIEFFGDLSGHISHMPDISVLQAIQYIFKYYREGRRQNAMGRDPKTVNHIFNIWLRSQISPVSSQSAAAQKPIGTYFATELILYYILIFDLFTWCLSLCMNGIVGVYVNYYFKVTIEREYERAEYEALLKVKVSFQSELEEGLNKSLLFLKSSSREAETTA